MALRDQPYIPLYIQDLMTDEKLNNCCASTHGVYIKGIMCLMHKSENYGKILLQQKFKQTDKQSKNFAIMLVKHLPYSLEEIENAIDELIEENVCYFEDDFICQKRMIKDGALSLIRSKVGKKGGDKTKENNNNLVNNLLNQNIQQNTEYENEIESESNLTNSSNSSNNTNSEISKKIILPIQFSDVSTELKTHSKTKEFCVKTYFIKPNDYDRFVDWFIGTKNNQSDDEIVCFKEWNQFFKEWMKFNYDKLPQAPQQKPISKIFK